MTDELWAIVRALAESNPFDGETGDCIMCGAIGKPIGVTLTVPEGDHDDDCAYTRAVRLVAADPAPTDQPTCTGVSARWCPVHGDCVCRGVDLDSPACPLHCPLSSHGDAPAADPAPTSRRLNVNPEPLQVVTVPVCQGCHKRAPWCSCGAMDYVSAADPAPTDDVKVTNLTAEDIASAREGIDAADRIRPVKLPADPAPTGHITPDKFVSKVAQEAEAFRVIDPAPTVRVGCITPDGTLLRGHFGPCSGAGHQPVYAAADPAPTQPNNPRWDRVEELAREIEYITDSDAMVAPVGELLDLLLRPDPAPTGQAAADADVIRDTGA